MANSESDSVRRKASGPKIATKLTTIAGLPPLMAEQSLQAQVLIPLAVSIAFGLMASTVLVLLVIPCLYVTLADCGLARLSERESSHCEPQV